MLSVKSLMGDKMSTLKARLAPASADAISSRMSMTSSRAGFGMVTIQSKMRNMTRDRTERADSHKGKNAK